MINECILIGRLGSDPEFRVLDSGNSVSNFSLATSRKYKNKQDEMIEDTQWHRIVCFGKLAELTDKYIKKGSQVFVKGEIRYRSYDNKDGVKVYITEIFASVIKFLDAKKEGSGQQKAEQQAESYPESNNSDGPPDDLPF